MGVSVISRCHWYSAVVFYCRARPSYSWSVLLLLVLGLSACTAEGGKEAAPDSAEETELAVHMADLQRWSHKTALALQARNPALADFYLHELEETVETIQEEAPTYEGHPIADLTDQLLVPRVEELGRALDERSWSLVDKRVNQMAQACNQCHAQTDHGFVRIDLKDVPNPYVQDFAPSE